MAKFSFLEQVFSKAITMRSKILFASIFSILGLSSCQQEKPLVPPNIILIMADDLGYGGIGCYGNEEINTPHLDAMAAQGIRFTDFHSNGAVCTPTRAALLTGRYQQRSGLEGVIYVRGETRQTGMDSTEVTIANLLRAEGYSTGIMGKWHLGYNETYNPVHQGFDEFYGYVSGNVDFHSHYDNAGIYDWWHNTDSLYEEGYTTDLITQHSINFIEEHQEEPFFLYVPHEAPHVPFQGRRDTAFRFPDRDFSYFGPVEDRHRAYKEMVEVMDEGIGGIIEKVRQLGLEENTFILFISDNGGLKGYGDNGSLRGAKTNLYEGGHRVPAIAYWKGKFMPSVSDETCMSFDLLPTILSLCGIIPPTNHSFDGEDISEHLLEGKPILERPLFWRYRGQKVVRKGDWKLMISEQDTALYNLKEDLSETNNLLEEQPEGKEQLLKHLEEWEKEVGAVDEQKTI